MRALELGDPVSRGDATHLRQTGGRRRVDVPYFQSDSHAHTHITHARFIRTCVAIKPQKLFFLNGGLPFSSRSFERGRAAGASANAVITPLECARVATGNAHAFIRIARTGRRSMTNLEASRTSDKTTVRLLNFENLYFIACYSSDRTLEKRNDIYLLYENI